MATDQRELSTTTVNTDDWPAKATDSIVKVVDTVHDKVTGPIQTIARGVAFGLSAFILATGAFVLLTILLFRLLNNYLPDAWFGEQHMWVSYLIVGTLYCVIALVLWSYREPKNSEP